METLNALAKAERQKLWKILMADAPVFHSHFTLVPRASEISVQTLSAVNDCTNFSLATREVREMMTADDRHVKNLQGRFPFVRSLADLS